MKAFVPVLLSVIFLAGCATDPTILAMRGDKNAVIAALDEGISPNYKVSEYGPSLLFYAVIGPDTDLAKELIQRGANVRDDQNLYYAAASITQDKLETLLNNGLDVDRTLIAVSSTATALDRVKFLLKRGAKINAHTPQVSAGGTALLASIQFAYNSEASVKSVPSIKDALLKQRDAALERANFLLQQGADPNIANAAGNTALLAAVQLSGTEMAQALIKAGADQNVRDAQGNTAKTLLAGRVQATAFKVVTAPVPQPPAAARHVTADRIKAPQPISGNGGKYMSPFTSNGALAMWVDGGRTSDHGSDVAGNVGGAVGEHVGQKALEFIPFGLGSFVGQQAGQATARAATQTTTELPSMEFVKANSDISFNTINELAVYMYVKDSGHAQYAHALSVAQKVYPELQQNYNAAIENAALSTTIVAAKETKRHESNSASVRQKLKELQALKKDGLITEDEFKKKRQPLVDSL